MSAYSTLEEVDLPISPNVVSHKQYLNIAGSELIESVSNVPCDGIVSFLAENWSSISIIGYRLMSHRL